MKPEYGIADAHTHIFPPGIAQRAADTISKFYGLSPREAGTIERLLHNGAKVGVTRYLVCSVALKPAAVQNINNFIFASCREHPEFIGFATIHPNMKDWEAEISRIKDRGFYGVKVHADFQKFSIDDPQMIEIYRALARCHLVLLCHMGDERGDGSSPARLRRAFDAVPELTCIAAHMGGYRSWDEAVCVLPVSDRLYFDTSSSLSFMAAPKAEHIIRHFGAERFLFGTDFPMWSHEKELRLFMNLNLTVGEQRKILHDNFENLFRILV